jgi:hypothetical protein
MPAKLDDQTRNRHSDAWNGDNGRHGTPVLWEGRKTANIHANSGFIWGIPDYRKSIGWGGIRGLPSVFPSPTALRRPALICD